MEENRRFDAGHMRFTFCDAEGEVIASFRVNPTDTGLLARAEEVAEYFRSLAADAALPAAEQSRRIEEKLSYLLGYDAADELFGRVPAMTVSPDGEIFAVAVLDAVAESVVPEIRRRAEKLRERTAKYTARYGES